MKIILSKPRGFCAGVQRALEITQLALKKYPLPIYCLHELVHNEQVVSALRAQGIVFVEDIEDVPPGAVLIFSAHGVSPAVRETAAERHLRTVDATCPFVQRIHVKVRRCTAEGYTALLIGHKQHSEMIGVQGEAPADTIIVQTPEEVKDLTLPETAKLAVLTQTTLSEADTEAVMQELRAHFSHLTLPDTKDICYATRNRQYAAQKLARLCDLVLVLGSASSSNTNRLVEVIQRSGTTANLVSECSALDNLPLENIDVIGITAGASTSEDFVQEVLALLNRNFNDIEVTELEALDEDVKLKIPRQL